MTRRASTPDLHLSYIKLHLTTQAWISEHYNDDGNEYGGDDYDYKNVDDDYGNGVGDDSNGDHLFQCNLYSLVFSAIQIIWNNISDNQQLS